MLIKQTFAKVHSCRVAATAFVGSVLLLTPVSRVAHVTPQASASATNNAWPIRPVATSPSIAALRKSLASGDSRALQQFWEMARQNDTPFMQDGINAGATRVQQLQMARLRATATKQTGWPQ